MGIEQMNPAQNAAYYEKLERAYARKGDTAMAAAMKSKRLAALGLEEYDDEGAAPQGRALAAAAAAPSAPAASSEHIPIIILNAETAPDRDEVPEIVPMAAHAPEPSLSYCPPCIIQSDEEGKVTVESIGNPSAAVPSSPDWRPIEIVGGDE